MFSLDAFEFETLANRHLYDAAANDLYLCDENSSDSDLYSSYNSDQENNLEKLWVDTQKKKKISTARKCAYAVFFLGQNLLQSMNEKFTCP